jgi:hypothetical protein
VVVVLAERQVALLQRRQVQAVQALLLLDTQYKEK